MHEVIVRILSCCQISTSRKSFIEGSSQPKTSKNQTFAGRLRRAAALFLFLYCLPLALMGQSSAPGPVINKQPVSQTVQDGSTATFTVSATGTGTLTYSWQYLTKSEWLPFKTGTGYNSPTFTTPVNDEGEDGFQVRVVVTDGNRLFTASNAAVLTVLQMRLTKFTCSNVSVQGAATDPCTVKLNIGAPSSGLIVKLSSNNKAVTVPATITIPGSATSAEFSATVAQVATGVPVKLTASADNTTANFFLLLGGVSSTLNVATSGSPSTYSGAVTFTATFTSGASGTVYFLDGATAIGTGKIGGSTATLSTSSLTAGNHTITAYWPGNAASGAITSPAITQIVNPATPAVKWGSPAAIMYGTPLSATQLDATSSVAGTFTYKPAIGSVLTAGQQTLSATFTPNDTGDYRIVTAVVPVTVNRATPSITWPTPASITYGTTLSSAQLDASSPVAGTFRYSAAAGSVLTAGTQTITVTLTPTDAVDYTATTASVNLKVNQAKPAITWATPAPISSGTALSAAQLDASSTVAGNFAYTPAAGTVLGAGPQTLWASFTPTDTTDYTAARASVILTVQSNTLTTPTISWTAPTAISYGTALSAIQLDATTTVAGTFIYKPAAGAVLKAGAHTLSVTFTPTNANQYTAATASVSLNVSQAVPVVQWAQPASINYGAALSTTQLNATASVPGAISYSAAAGTVLTAGSHVMSATFTPTDIVDYTTATASVTLIVNKVTPIISWATPAAISAGDALNSAQLDATATVAGLFVYSPAAGTVLPSGSQTLSVTFTPTDTTDYTSASKSVTLTVNATKGTPTLSINATSIAFGNVALNTPSAQTLTLSSTGTASVTVSSATLVGVGFSMSGPALPVTLAPGQTQSLEVQFDPTLLGVAAGVLTITSTSSANAVIVVVLAGTGTTANYAVELTWDAPSSSSDPIAGYNVYRAPSGTSTYQLLNSSVNSQTTFTDSSVQSGQAYDYIIESVDESGVLSTPTSPVLVSVP
jgi:Bacterial Ig-like domain (group 3)/Abnormal spindle-like microcephaly-assoc'd, ASPM-SPD-2-Hydin